MNRSLSLVYLDFDNPAFTSKCIDIYVPPRKHYPSSPVLDPVLQARTPHNVRPKPGFNIFVVNEIFLRHCVTKKCFSPRWVAVSTLNNLRMLSWQEYLGELLHSPQMICLSCGSSLPTCSKPDPQLGHLIAI